MKTRIMRRIGFIICILIIPVITYSQSGIDCTENTFWSFNGLSIDAYTITPDMVTFVENVWTGKPVDPSLAYCNNLNGGDFSPTFYATAEFFTHPAWFDGSDWVTTTASVSPDKIYNPGGNGDYLYYQLVKSGTTYPSAVVRYDGTAFITVFECADSKRLEVADLPVDSNGNVFIFTGISGGTTSITDSLFIVSPDGEILNSYPFVFDTYSSPGAFFLNGMVYLYLASGNLTHPNSFIPITITPDTVIAGDPIHSVITGSDMASCTFDFTLSNANVNTAESPIQIHPNPANEKLYITHQDILSNAFIQIFDNTGRMILKVNIEDDNTTIDISNFSPGIYLVQFVIPNEGINQTIKTEKLMIF